jgi:hypothetical protein
MWEASAAMKPWHRITKGDSLNLVSNSCLGLKRTLFVSSIAIALITNCSVEALAFKKFGADWTYKRPKTPMGEPFQICIADAPPGAVAVIRKAAGAWNSRTFTFNFRAEGCASSGQFPVENGVDQIDFGPIETAAPALSRQFYHGADIVECDIRFNATLRWNVAEGPPTAEEWDLMSAALHEFGHCLGLTDVQTPSRGEDPVMDHALGPGEMRRVLSADDRQGRDSIYGK